MEFWLALLLFSSLFYKGYSCSCISGYQSITRAQTICSNYFNSPNVYKATVEVAYCKCLPDLQQREQFSCIKFWKRGEEIVGAAQSSYICDNNTYNSLGSSYSKCSNVISSATNMDAAAVNVSERTTPVINVSCRGNSDYSTGEGCDLTIQPCYYTVSIDEVYRGLYKVGQSLNVSGPDVLTSCGQYGRVLTVGQSYIAGIGGACYPINSWAISSSFSTDEFRLLAELQNGSMTCNSSTRLYIYIPLLFIALFIVITML